MTVDGKNLTYFGRAWGCNWVRIPRRLLRGMRAGTKMDRKFSTEGSPQLVEARENFVSTKLQGVSKNRWESLMVFLKN
jgi:hypothetical protein